MRRPNHGTDTTEITIISEHITDDKLAEFIQKAKQAQKLSDADIDYEDGELPFFEIEAEFHFSWTTGCKGARGEYGEPLEPDEPGELYIDQVFLGDFECTDYFKSLEEHYAETCGESLDR